MNLDNINRSAMCVAKIAPIEPAKPFVDDDGIYVPSSFDSRYHQCLITRELFVEAYNKWIKPNKRSFVKFGEDTADDWSE